MTYLNALARSNHAGVNLHPARTPKNACSGLASSLLSIVAIFLLFSFHNSTALAMGNRIHIEKTGSIEGTYDEQSGIRSFKGVPFAAPPVGGLRWKRPTPARPWSGVRPAKEFGPRPMQLPLFGDMNFRSGEMSEDCLYLNVWTPARSEQDRLPVLLYFYGGGFAAGDGSEPRYDGESMAKRGIVTVTANYRLGIFGFFAHPALARENPDNACGNYGFLDQAAALHWVHNNIAAFGGDPGRITIAGESAGSISVSALMASPLTKDLIAGAIGESGSILGTFPPLPIEEAEKQGKDIAGNLGIGGDPSIEELRAIPAEKLLQTLAKGDMIWFSPTLDGYFFREDPVMVFAAGKQAQAPLLAGVNSEEMGYAALLGGAEPTVENYKAALKRLYPHHFEEVFKVYSATDQTGVMDAAQDLAGDRFISHGTWKWIDLATKTGNSPTFYYLFARPRPPMRPEMGNAVPGLAGGVVKDPDPALAALPRSRGAVHSAEIEYALGNLHSNKVYAWTEEDKKVSETMQSYFANFIRTGNPNEIGLPEWPLFKTGRRLVIDVETREESTQHLRERYAVLDQVREQEQK
jgi:para-nitrobenzyl esterase